MGRTSGQETKEKILKIAEQLFAEKGVDATSVDEIARIAEVNKALIYYHYKNKEDLKNTLYLNLTEELFEFISRAFAALHSAGGRGEDVLKEMIRFLTEKKAILSTLLMESVKTEGSGDRLFEIAQVLISKENSGIEAQLQRYEKGKFNDTKQLLVHEFFTGFIPIILFVIFRDRFGNFFQFTQEELLDHFLLAFKRSHMADHFKAEE